MANVLLIDDYAPFREAMAYCLPTFGHATFTAADAREALAVAERSRIDVLLIDAGVPLLTGFAVCDELRHSVRLRDTPFIILTADDGVLIRTEAIRVGASAIIRKPFAWPDLLRAIEESAARSLRAAQSAKGHAFPDCIAPSGRAMVEHPGEDPSR